jgi:hypothetical protein
VVGYGLREPEEYALKFTELTKDQLKKLINHCGNFYTFQGRHFGGMNIDIAEGVLRPGLYDEKNCESETGKKCARKVKSAAELMAELRKRYPHK